MSLSVLFRRPVLVAPQTLLQASTGLRCLRTRPSRRSGPVKSKESTRESPKRQLGRVERREFGPGRSRTVRAVIVDKRANEKPKTSPKAEKSTPKIENVSKPKSTHRSAVLHDGDDLESVPRKSNPTDSSTKPALVLGKNSLLLFGRKTVLDAILDKEIKFERLFLCDKLRDDADEVDRNDSSATPVKSLVAAAHARKPSLKIEYISRKDLSSITKHQNQDQGVAAVVESPPNRSISLQEFLSKKPHKYRIIALEGISSETNMGTIVRSAAASPSIDAVLLLENCCSIQNPIVQFASCGVALKANFIYTPMPKKTSIESDSSMPSGYHSTQALKQLKADGAKICVLAPAATENFYDFEAPDKVVFVLGAESTGVSNVVMEEATNRLRIPLARSVESLSVASAAAVVAFCEPGQKTKK